MAANMARYDENHRCEFGWRTRLMLANVKAMRSTDYIQAQRFRTRAIKHFSAALHVADVIATPTTPITASQLDERSLPHGELNVGKIIEVMRFVNPANFTGLPAITVPAGYDKGGMPIGLQLMARPWEEELLFHRSSWLMQLRTSLPVEGRVCTSTCFQNSTPIARVLGRPNRVGSGQQSE